MPQLQDDLRAFAAQNGLAFGDASLMRMALTHTSYLNEHPGQDLQDNERLEYLGDAVLDLVLADYLFAMFPDASEGQLTGLRAALVRRDTLARLARSVGIDAVILLGHGEVATGGRARAATLCAAFEALVGALYLDGGLDAVKRWVLPQMEKELGAARVEVSERDPKSRLQELAQGALGVTPRYRTLGAEGPDHAKVFAVDVSIGDAVCGYGEGANKRLAEQSAAVDALSRVSEWLSGE